MPAYQVAACRDGLSLGPLDAHFVPFVPSPAERLSQCTVHPYSSLMHGGVGGVGLRLASRCVLLCLSCFFFSPRVRALAPPPCWHLPDPGDARCVARRLRRPGREHRLVSSFCDGGRELIRRCHQGSLHAGAHRWRMRRHCSRRRSIPARHSAHKNAGASARAHGQLERARTHLMRPRTLHRRRRKAS